MADIKIAKDNVHLGVDPIFERDETGNVIGINAKPHIIVSGVYMIPNDQIPESPHYVRPLTLWERFMKWLKIHVARG